MTGVRARVTDRVHVAEVVLPGDAATRGGDGVERVAVLGPPRHDGRITATSGRVGCNRIRDEDRGDDARVRGGGGRERRRYWRSAPGAGPAAVEDATAPAQVDRARGAHADRRECSRVGPVVGGAGRALE